MQSIDKIISIQQKSNKITHTYNKTYYSLLNTFTDSNKNN